MGEFTRGQRESVAALEADDEDSDAVSEAEPEQESVVHDDNSELATSETDSKSTT